MGRHEIRFRRNKMTSRRLERHKNYEQLMKQHKLRKRGRLVRLLIYFMIMLFMLLLIYFSISRVTTKTEDKKTSVATTQGIALPDFSNTLTLKLSKNGKSQKP